MKVVEQFKRRILDLAIRGKLVPQDPNDEPASVLLERIKAEKAKLVKAGKIKKEKNSSEIVIGSDGAAYAKLGDGDSFNTEARRHRVDVPFKLPQGWAWARLGEVGSWKAGATPSRKVADYYVGGVIPWLKTGDLNDGVVTYIPESITEKAIAETSVRLNPVGTILIAMYGATIGRIGLLGIAATTNQACCACIVERQIYNRYLFYYLMAQREHFRSLGGGGAQPNISKDIITSYPFPVPPLAEQRRIVAKIDELFAIADSMGDAADGLGSVAKQLDKKILDLAIRGKLVPQDPNDEPASELVKRIAASYKSPCKNQGEHIDPPFDLPHGWVWTRIGDVYSMKAGKHVSAEDIHSHSAQFQYPCYGGNGIRGYVAEYSHEGNYAVVGRQGALCGNLNYATDKFYATEHAVVVTTYCDVSARFTYWFLMALDLNRYATATAQPGLSVKEVEKVSFPLPPIAEQKRIVAKIEELRAVIKSLTK